MCIANCMVTKQNIEMIDRGDCLCTQIDCEQIRSRINQQQIAEHFGNEGLHHLCTKPLYAGDEGLRGRNILQLVVD